MTNYRWFTALIAALVTATLVAYVIPRFGGDGEVNWFVTIGASLGAAVGVLLATRQTVDDGRTVRDDALPPE